MYCKHGIYVGGCGVDYMCGACECGEPDPTIAELREWIAADTIALEQNAEWIESLMIGSTLTASDISSIHFPAIRSLQSMRSQLEYAEVWAVSITDDNWLRRTHNANMMRG